MILNRPRSRSQNFRIKYFEYRVKYNVGHSASPIGNHKMAFDWYHEQL